MTATLSRPSRKDVLTERLKNFRAQRAQVRAEVTPAGCGDDADRATNVDGHVRLAMLEERIIAVEVELAADEKRATRSSDDTVDVGDIVTVDFGDGPETYLVGSVEAAGDGLDVITPGSPLGMALRGAQIGSTVSYSPRSKLTIEAKVVAIT